MAEVAKKEVCGLVMPISGIESLSEAHWADVLSILSDSIEKAGFAPNLVSNADDVGIIQKRIIQNLYDNPIAVVDVSAKNPNVMFELGMRLAFDKPTIIVKDDKTSYSFDTAPIEHLVYPRDLRFTHIVDFKNRLIEKIKGTHTKATTDPNYTTFLKNFGEFTVAKLDKKEVSSQEFILEEIKGLRRLVEKVSLPPATTTSGIQFVNIPYGPGRSRERLASDLLRTYSVKPGEVFIVDDDTFAPKKDDGKKEG
jgi:hypothetical protein